MRSVLRVEEPGLLSTLQDLGRPAHRAAGVPLGGAMDRFALVAANLLVGNAEGAPALECTSRGPKLTALDDCRVCVAGARFDTRVNGDQVYGWAPLDLQAGDTLDVGRRVSGARAYLSVAGGFAGDRWLGSFSTYLLVGRGGIAGRALAADDILGAGDTPAAPRRAASISANVPRYFESAELAAIPGPHDSRLERASRRALFREEFEVLPESDRMGFRLAGPALEGKQGEMLSFGVAPGCVQLTASGPIMLMADHQTAGGYPVVGTVSRAGIATAAQLVAGDRLRFRETTVEAAQAEWARLRSTLDSLRG